MSSSHKKTQKQKRPIINKDKVNDDDYVQMEVTGDGNCFYYSVYGAAKYHADSTVFGKLLACLEIENKPTLTPQEFAKKVRVKLAREIIKPVGIMEAQAAVAVERRGALEFREQKSGNLYTMMLEASKHIWAPTKTIEYADLTRMLKESERELEQAKARYKAAATATATATAANAAATNANANANATATAANAAATNANANANAAADAAAAKRAAVKDIAKFMKEVRHGKQNIVNILKPASGRAHWDIILQEVSRELGNHPLLSKARAYETMTKEQFKDAFAKILAGNALDGNSFMYASQPDVEILRFFLSKCGTPLKIFPINPNKDRIADSSNGIPVLNVVLLFRGGYEHYNYYVRGNKYKEHIGRFERPAVRVKKQHVAKGNTPNTPESKASLSPASNSNSSLSPASNSNSSLSSLSSLSSVSNSNSSNSTKRAKKTHVATKATAATAATILSRNISADRKRLEQMRAEKAAANAQKVMLIPSGKNVTKHLRKKVPNPFNSNTESSNNNATYPSNIPKDLIEEGKRLEKLRKTRLANAKFAALRPQPIPSAPPASPPIYSAAAVANNLNSNSNNEDAELQAALKASKEEYEKTKERRVTPGPALAPNKTHKNRIASILALYNQPSQPSKTQANLIKSLGPKRKGGSVTGSKAATVTRRHRSRKH
jgi:hypothetical protein